MTDQLAAGERRAVAITVNGTARSAAVESRRTLSDFLRHDLGLTGTHVGCEHGVCGACTVLLDGEPARSCLMFAVTAHGHRVTTVEGLGQLDDAGDPPQMSTLRVDLHGPTQMSTLRVDLQGPTQMSTLRVDLQGPTLLSPVQRAFRDCHALQCGFCTPGFLTTITAGLIRNPAPTRDDAVEMIAGNLCRCTGYQNIVDAVLRAAELTANPDGEQSDAHGPTD